MDYSDYKNNFNYLLGGDESVNPFSEIAPDTVNKFPNRKGVFSMYPAATPKYAATNDDRSLETMARLLVPLPDEPTKRRFVASFTKNVEARKLAEALAHIDGEAHTGDRRSGLGYIDFLLTSTQEPFREKMQLIEVVGDNFVSFFSGAKPPIFQYSGILLNTCQDDWRSAFIIIYNDIIRGTELARRRAVVTLAYDNLSITGSCIGMSQLFTAEQQMAATFNFQLVVQRIDVTRVTGHVPTALESFPTYITPAPFAIKQFDVPPKTIRAIGVPSSMTVERQKEVQEDDINPFGELEITKAKDNVHGGSTQTSDPHIEIEELLNGGGQSILNS